MIREIHCVFPLKAAARWDVFFVQPDKWDFSEVSTPGEIIEQVLYFSRQLKTDEKKVTNIVFMGMGEPFHNYEATMKAIDILNDKNGFNLGARRFTVSTVGIVPQIIRFADENRQVNLAVSLHSIDNAIRSNMMPVNKKYPVEELLKACAYYVEKTNRRISFEWALIEGINDSPEMARRLAGRLHHLICHVNLIQLNPTTKYGERRIVKRLRGKIYGNPGISWNSLHHTSSPRY